MVDGRCMRHLEVVDVVYQVDGLGVRVLRLCEHHSLSRRQQRSEKIRNWKTKKALLIAEAEGKQGLTGSAVYRPETSVSKNSQSASTCEINGEDKGAQIQVGDGTPHMKASER